MLTTFCLLNHVQMVEEYPPDDLSSLWQSLYEISNYSIKHCGKFSLLCLKRNGDASDPLVVHHRLHLYACIIRSSWRCPNSFCRSVRIIISRVLHLANRWATPRFRALRAQQRSLTLAGVRNRHVFRQPNNGWRKMTYLTLIESLACTQTHNCRHRVLAAYVY